MIVVVLLAHQAVEVARQAVVIVAEEAVHQEAIAAAVHQVLAEEAVRQEVAEVAEAAEDADKKIKKSCFNLKIEAAFL